MGTRGYRVIRFRGRYYRYYNHWDSYPEGLGKKIACEIPSDPKAYQEWLAAQRQEALKWHDALERFLCRKSAEDVDDDERITANEKQAWGVATENLPDFRPALNDLYIEWVYTIDLDNEVFTIDNGAHVKLIQASDLVWIGALAQATYGDKVLLPRCVPQEAIADIVLKLPAPSSSTLTAYEDLKVKIVEATGLNGFDPSRRHGPLFRSRIFYFLREIYEHVLAATLLSWTEQDLPFREIAYAVLCLASANHHISIVSASQVSHSGGIGYANLENNHKNEISEFLAFLGVGCHLEGLPPGSSPDSRMYLFDGALVYLVAQLIDVPGILDAAVVSIVEHCQKERPNQHVKVILMSVEHVVLMRIRSDGRVSHTEPLPLFDICIHTTMDASQRYEANYLEELQKHKKRVIKKMELREKKRQIEYRVARGEEIEDELKNLQMNSDEQEDEEDETFDEQTSWPAADLRSPRVKESEAAFLALSFFLETASQQHMPRSGTNEGVFPTELYRIILSNIKDVETYHACMQVSRTFRELCQDNVVMSDGIVLQANAASKTYEQSNPVFPALRMKKISTREPQNVKLTRLGNLLGMGFLSDDQGKTRAPNEQWQVLVGSEKNRRSLIQELVMTFDPV